MADVKEMDDFKQYMELIDLHKFYFSQIITAAGFCLGVTGAIFTYVVTTALHHDQIRLALIAPLIVSVGAAVVFGLGIIKAIEFANVVKISQRQLNLAWRPHAEILVWMAIVFCILFFCMSIGLAYAFVDPSIVPIGSEKVIDGAAIPSLRPSAAMWY
jgi:hypothetical protein